MLLWYAVIPPRRASLEAAGLPLPPRSLPSGRAEPMMRGWRDIMDIDPAAITESLRGTLGELLGMRVVEAGPDRGVAELRIRDDLRTVGGALHRGTLMALADTVGAAATGLNPPPGARTTTLQAKTHFFPARRAGLRPPGGTPPHPG